MRALAVTVTTACLGVSGVAAGGSAQAATASSTQQAFQRTVDRSRSTLTSYWSGYFAGRHRSFRSIRTVKGYPVGKGPRCGRLATPVRNNAEYCVPGDFIAFDTAFLLTGYQKIGGAFVRLALAHEYGHGIQKRLAVRPATQMDRELQADCLAGAYFGDESRRKVWPVTDADVEQLNAAFDVIGDRTSLKKTDPAAHGTPRQRGDAFSRGVKGSVAACL